MGSKLWLMHSADSFEVVVVLYVKVTMEVQHFSPLLSLHDVLQESFTFTFHLQNEGLFIFSFTVVLLIFVLGFMIL
jgi:hypothetical protein